MDKNVVLIGFMGSGKSTIGKILSQKINKSFIDIDEEIIKLENRTINEIFNENGEGYFRELEKKTIKKISRNSNIIIATGGGAIENLENINSLKKTGVLIYLKAEFDEILNRLKNSTDRPIAAKGQKVLEERFKKREITYENQADITIYTDNKSPTVIAEEIISAI